MPPEYPLEETSINGHYILNKGHIGIRSTVPCNTVEPLNKRHFRIRSTVPCSTVEPLNKGHIGIRSTVPCSTVQLLNKGHIGIRSTVPCREAVLRQMVFLYRGCPYFQRVLYPIVSVHPQTRLTTIVHNQMIGHYNLHLHTIYFRSLVIQSQRKTVRDFTSRWEPSPKSKDRDKLIRIVWSKNTAHRLNGSHVAIILKHIRRS